LARERIWGDGHAGRRGQLGRWHPGRLEAVLQQLIEYVCGQRSELHAHLGPAAADVLELHSRSERLDDRQANAECLLLLGADARLDARSVVAHYDFDRLTAHVY